MTRRERIASDHLSAEFNRLFNRLVPRPAARDESADVCECGHVRDEHDGDGDCCAEVKGGTNGDGAFACACRYFDRQAAEVAS